MRDAVLTLENISRIYASGAQQVEVLRGVDLAIGRGEVVALVGPSGSGKTTLLQIAGLLDAPTSGRITINGQDASAAGDTLRTRLRLAHLGFVYQFHHLLPEFSALENVMLPQMVAGKTRAEAQARAEFLLAEIGLAARAQHRPAALSGGECQRVAICRAMANEPALLLADEPTGNLDPLTAEQVFQSLLLMSRQHGLAALIATHNHDLARRMDRAVTMKEGKLVAF